MTFFVLTCTVAVGDAAQNHSDSARNVCHKEAAQMYFVEVLQLENILCFKVSRYMKATVSGVFEDLKFKIAEGLDQNQSCPDSALLAVSV